MKEQMKLTRDLTLTAPCGIYCGDCECYKAKDDPKLLAYLVSASPALKKGGLPCGGCRPINGKCPAVEDVCATYTCTLEHRVDFCFECSEFPCGKLNPSADRANTLPHNMKVFNLCYIKNYGLEKFVVQQPEIRKKYYKSKMIIGNGPHIE
jgi:hypothetical protein